MIEGKEEISQEDLSEFSDYLSEFDDIVNFDSEICPICGISVSDSMAIQKFPYVIFKTFKNESDLLSLTEKFQSKDIPFKVEKRINPEVLMTVDYVFDILVPVNHISELEKEEV